jgi:hypothetical protein
MKVVEKRVSPVPFDFKCQRCRILMRVRTPHTAVWEGEKDADGNWVTIENITFLCAGCEPINDP